MKYYVITCEAAQTMRLTTFRRRIAGGYIVTSGDLVTAPQQILAEAKEITPQQAKTILKSKEK